MGSLAFARHFLTSQFTTVPDIKHSFAGQTIIVTGSNTGLGFEAAKHYARLGAEKIILAVRSLDKGNKAKGEIEAVTGRTGVIEVWTLDMGSYASIQEFAKKAESLNRIDILLENAGMMSHTWTTSAEGIETTMAVNVYGTILLALLMIPILKSSAKRHNIHPVITIVSSEAHHFTSMKQVIASSDPLTFLNDETKFDKTDRYNVTKILEVFYVRELAKYLDANRDGVIVNLANPGMCKSEFGRDLPVVYQWALAFVRMLIARETVEGAKTIVWPTTAGQEGHGQYSLDCTFNEEAISRFVRSEDGAKWQKHFYEGINERLEKYHPGLVKKAVVA